MKSPFPGMDPYLERHWGDVHTSLITYARDQLRGQLPPALRVRVEEHVAIESDEERLAGFYPDIRVIERPTSEQAEGSGGVAVADEDPLLWPIEPATQRSLYIIDTTSGDRIVTAIEIISPANKYLKKQADMVRGGVNLVEIDLLREGRDVLYVPARQLVNGYAEYAGPYRICVVRATRPGPAELYKASFRRRLPTIKIPLRANDPDARLNLQALIEQAYENGGYGDDINYRRQLHPPLEGDDAAWADALLREKGRRS